MAGRGGRLPVIESFLVCWITPGMTRCRKLPQRLGKCPECGAGGWGLGDAAGVAAAEGGGGDYHVVVAVGVGRPVDDGGAVCDGDRSGAAFVVVGGEGIDDRLLALAGQDELQRAGAGGQLGGGDGRDLAGVRGGWAHGAGEAGQKAVWAVYREGVLPLGWRGVPGVGAGARRQDRDRRGGKGAVGVGVDGQRDAYVAGVGQGGGDLAGGAVHGYVGVRLVIGGAVRAGAWLLGGQSLPALGRGRGRAAG